MPCSGVYHLFRASKLFKPGYRVHHYSDVNWQGTVVPYYLYHQQFKSFKEAERLVILDGEDIVYVKWDRYMTYSCVYAARMRLLPSAMLALES